MTMSPHGKAKQVRRVSRGFLTGVALAAALLLVLPSAAVQAQGADLGDPPVQRVQNIQNMLKTLGYDPGPADGVPGSRTVSAIIAFQRKAGLAQTGQPDTIVYKALVRRLTDNEKPAAGEPTIMPSTKLALTRTSRRATPIAMPPQHYASATKQTSVEQQTTASPPAVAGKWLIIDDNGSRQTLQLDPKGTIAAVSTPGIWKWQLKGGSNIVIKYDNGMGGWVRRDGQVVDANRITGDAESSRGRSWSWTATRISDAHQRH